MKATIKKGIEIEDKLVSIPERKTCSPTQKIEFKKKQFFQDTIQKNVSKFKEHTNLQIKKAHSRLGDFEIQNHQQDFKSKERSLQVSKQKL